MRHSKPKDGVMHSIVGQNIKNIRSLRSWTQEQLADAAEVTSRTVQRAEAGEPVAAESLQAIAGALGVGLDELRRDQAAEDQKKLMERYIRVDMVPVREGPELLTLTPWDALLVQANGPEIAVRHADALAALRDALTDMGDVWDEAPASTHLEWVRGLEPVLRTLHEAGASVTAGVFDAATRPAPGQASFRLRSLVIMVASAPLPVALVDKKNLSFGF